MTERREVPSGHGAPRRWVVCDGVDGDGPAALETLRMAVGDYGGPGLWPGHDRYAVYDDCLEGYESQADGMSQALGPHTALDVLTTALEPRILSRTTTRIVATASTEVGSGPGARMTTPEVADLTPDAYTNCPRYSDAYLGSRHGTFTYWI